jgi:outer membrane protein TolC
MKAPIALAAILSCVSAGGAMAQQVAEKQGTGQPNGATPRRLTLQEAVDLALQHNHVVRISKLSVEQKQYAKEIARSAYFPVLHNDSTFVHLTDTQFIEIPTGSLGNIGTVPIPQQPLILNQGGVNLTTSGTALVQPLTQLLKVKAGNDVAQADLNATRGKSRGVENQIALTVHELYYRILITEVRHSAVQAKIQASDDLQSERVQQVKFGSALDAELIESKAQSLQSKQELLSTELQLSDLHMQFNELIGLPLTTAVVLDANVGEAPDNCAKEDCIKLALQSNPEVAEARAELQKAESGVRLSKLEYIPDVAAFARYDYADNVPFLARNFGSFGVHLTYDLFDGGKKRAVIHERETQLAQARENLTRINDEVELRVQTVYNKLERTREMVAVSQELLALRNESRRVSAEQLTQGSALRSQAQAAVAQELEAKALLLQSQLDYVQAHDELLEATGQTPER